jgi:hypothetical protein
VSQSFGYIPKSGIDQHILNETIKYLFNYINAILSVENGGNEKTYFYEYFAKRNNGRIHKICMCITIGLAGYSWKG